MADFVNLNFWNNQLELCKAAFFISNKRFFSDVRSRINFGDRKGTVSEATVFSWGVGTAHEDEVPSSILPDSHVYVSREPLLLAASIDIASHIAVSHIAATSITCSGVRGIISEDLNITFDLNSAHRSGL